MVVVVHLEDAVHPHQRDDEAAFGREGTAREPRPRAARHEGQPFAVGELHDLGDLLGRGGKDDEVGECPEQHQPIGLVDEKLFRLGKHGALAEQAFELAAEGLLAGGVQVGHA